jgi:hypothetical protein
VVFFATVFEIEQKNKLGFHELAEQLTSKPEFRDSIVLCSSDANGEGAMISEVAMREARPGHIILRASRMLADSDWNGRNYKLRMKTTAEVQQFLESAAIEIVVLDLTPGERFEHHKLIQAAMADPRWRRIGQFPATIDSHTARNARIELWRQPAVSRAPKPRFTVEMRPTPKISISKPASH